MSRYMKIQAFLFLGLALFWSKSALSYAFEEVKFVQQIRTNLAAPYDVDFDKSGSIYVVDKELSKVFVYAQNGELKFEFGGLGQEEGQFQNPQSIAVSSLGKIFVADTGNHRVQVFNKVGKFLYQFGIEGTVPGHFQYPVGVAVDEFGFVFVADRDNKRVQAFSPNGIYLDVFKTEAHPYDLGIDRNRNLYVLLPEVGTVAKYSPQGKKLKDLRCVFNNYNYISGAAGITVDMRGDIYITDAAENSIKKFDEDENVLISFGSKGIGRGQFEQANGIAFNTEGDIFIADTDNARVQIFKIKGSEKQPITANNKSPIRVDFYTTIATELETTDLFSLWGKGVHALSSVEDHIRVDGGAMRKFGKTGKNPGDMLDPKAINVSFDGKIYVADTGNNRIQIFNTKGDLEYIFGETGKLPGQFNSPQGISLNSKGYIYITDTNNHRVQVFNNDGIFLNSLGEVRYGPRNTRDEFGVLRSPTAIEIDSHDRIYVVDNNKTRIQIFSKEGSFISSLTNESKRFEPFKEIIDIAFDENDNLYVADKGSSRIQIIDDQGNFVLAFGSPGDGRGYFQSLSAITASEGKIYIADSLKDQIQVFRFFPKGMRKQDLIYTTKTVSLPEELEENGVVRYNIAKNRALNQAIQEINNGIGASSKALRGLIKIEAVETIEDRQVKVTVSIPRSALEQ